MLECSDNTVYTGVTNNLERRFTEHENGINTGCHTYKRRPLKLIFHEKFTDVKSAISFEKKLKGWSRKKKKALINQDWDLLQKLSMNKINKSKEHPSTGSG
jgi:putative endonuclease